MKSDRAVTARKRVLKSMTLPLNTDGPLGCTKMPKAYSVEAFTGIRPRPTDAFFQWGAARIDYTVSLMSRYLGDGDRVMDIGSTPDFSLIVTRSLSNIHWVPTDAEGRRQTFTDSNANMVYTYEPQAFVAEPGPCVLPATDLNAVTMFEVLEHLPFHPSRLLAGINKSLRPGGFLFISTPNVGGRNPLIRALRGGSPHQTPFLDPGFWYHKREYSAWEVRQLVRWAGFDIVAHTTANVLLNEDNGYRAWIHHACFMLGAVLSLSAAEVRQLLQFSGSTQFMVGRKTRAVDETVEPLKV